MGGHNYAQLFMPPHILQYVHHYHQWSNIQFSGLGKISDGSRITVYSLIFCNYHLFGIIQRAYIVAHWEVSNGKLDLLHMVKTFLLISKQVKHLYIWTSIR